MGPPYAALYAARACVRACVLAGWLCACAVHHNEELLVKPGQRLVLRWKKRLAAALLVVVLCGGGPLGLRCVCVCVCCCRTALAALDVNEFAHCVEG